MSSVFFLWIFFFSLIFFSFSFWEIDFFSFGSQKKKESFLNKCFNSRWGKLLVRLVLLHLMFLWWLQINWWSGIIIPNVYVFLFISSADCSGKNPLEGPLKGELEEALALAERFTQQYDRLLGRFKERMANVSSILDLLNTQFGWVSALANRTGSDNIFQVQMVSVCFLLKSEKLKRLTSEHPHQCTCFSYFSHNPTNSWSPGSTFKKNTAKWTGRTEPRQSTGSTNHSSSFIYIMNNWL